MIWKSLQEEWPIEHDAVWIRYTKDGISYHEEVVSENGIIGIECLGIPEWRPLDVPEWLEDIADEKPL